MYLDGQRLKMAKGETEQEHIMALEHGELMLQWEMHRPDMGQAVEITSGMLPGFYLHPHVGGLQPAQAIRMPQLADGCVIVPLAVQCSQGFIFVLN